MARANDEEQIIAEIPKNQSEFIRVSRTTYNGLDLIDARVYLRPVVPGGAPRPTRKGLCLQPEAWHGVILAAGHAMGYRWSLDDDDDARNRVRAIVNRIADTLAGDGDGPAPE